MECGCTVISPGNFRVVVHSISQGCQKLARIIRTLSGHVIKICSERSQLYVPMYARICSPWKWYSHLSTKYWEIRGGTSNQISHLWINRSMYLWEFIMPSPPRVNLQNNIGSLPLGSNSFPDPNAPIVGVRKGNHALPPSPDSLPLTLAEEFRYQPIVGRAGSQRNRHHPNS